MIPISMYQLTRSLYSSLCNCNMVSTGKQNPPAQAFQVAFHLAAPYFLEQDTLCNSLRNSTILLYFFLRIRGLIFAYQPVFIIN